MRTKFSINFSNPKCIFCFWSAFCSPLKLRSKKLHQKTSFQWLTIFKESFINGTKKWRKIVFFPPLFVQLRSVGWKCENGHYEIGDQEIDLSCSNHKRQSCFFFLYDVRSLRCRIEFYDWIGNLSLNVIASNAANCHDKSNARCRKSMQFIWYERNGNRPNENHFNKLSTHA